MIFCCEHSHIVNQLTEDAFSEQEEDDYVLMVFLGIVTTSALSLSYDFRIRGILQRALDQGYGNTLAELTPGSIEFKLLQSFENNLGGFVAAKQYQQVRQMQEFLGIEFSQFKEAAKLIFSNYNEAWLSAEFETVVNAAKSGKMWLQFENQKASKPFLTYHTQHDARVRLEHRALEGITRKVDDPFWASYSPPNGYRCRCFLSSSSSAKETKDIPLQKISDGIPDMFKFNPGKKGMLFSTLHPYFEIKRGDSLLRKRNFNIPV